MKCPCLSVGPSLKQVRSNFLVHVLAAWDVWRGFPVLGSLTGSVYGVTSESPKRGLTRPNGPIMAFSSSASATQDYSSLAPVTSQATLPLLFWVRRGFRDLLGSPAALMTQTRWIGMDIAAGWERERQHREESSLVLSRAPLPLQGISSSRHQAG